MRYYSSSWTERFQITDAKFQNKKGSDSDRAGGAF
jgi:hypothetical protein